MILKSLFNGGKRREDANVNYGKTQSSKPATHVIFFKDGHLDAVKKVRGVKSDAEMARILGITRAYYSLIKARKKPVTHEVICKVAEVTGTIAQDWWAGLEICPVNWINPNHPSNNMAKYHGYKPYDRYSPSAEFREAEKGEKS